MASTNKIEDGTTARLNEKLSQAEAARILQDPDALMRVFREANLRKLILFPQGGHALIMHLSGGPDTAPEKQVTVVEVRVESHKVGVDNQLIDTDNLDIQTTLSAIAKLIARESQGYSQATFSYDDVQT